ncbi:hypothetical protein [Microlunatus soli]|uniref:Nitroreductase family protein n=1 Tax=Microlunatus soli TaxID=630515 RepID=A0A1H1WT89_9ACTN|nr:hypothetical protein [Microlunatus soli]SDT00275.1 hypothetical protein SAMN04489812_3792 [Microlunatus soli]
MTTDRRTAGRSSGPDESLLAELITVAASAPSAHNTQPWDPRISAGGIELGVAEGRTLPVGDGTGRDTLLALGAWTEAAAIAARRAGRELIVDTLPTLGDPELIVSARRRDPVARLTLGGAPRPTDDPARLLDADLLAARLTYRGPVRRADGFLTAAATVLPDWAGLVPITARDLNRMALLGTADTLTRPGAVEELASWLRLSPRHPQYAVDGLTDRVLRLPRPVAAVAAPFTRPDRPRRAAAWAARRGGDLLRRLLLEVPIEAAGDAADADHFTLVVRSNELAIGTGVELTRVLNSPLGLPPEVVFETGRVLLRVWLCAARMGAAFSPHSEVLDSALAQGELQHRLGLGRRTVPLFVASVGRPAERHPARSPRRRLA